MSDESLVSYLNLQGYNPIAIPREQFDPLTILVGNAPANLKYVGDLADLVQPGTTLPEIHRDDAVPAFGNRRSKELDGQAGFNVLGTLLAALGGSGAGISAAYGRASSVQYLFLEVLHDYVAPLRLANILDSRSLNPATVASLQSPLVYIVTDTLKSSQFAVVAYDGAHAKLQLDAAAIRDIVGAGVSVSAGSAADGLISYSGPRRLSFAFRALRLVIGANNIPRLLLDDTFIVARAVASATLPPEAYRVLAPGKAVELSAG